MSAEDLRVPTDSEIARALREQAGISKEAPLGFSYYRDGNGVRVNATGGAWGVYELPLVSGDVPPGEGIVSAVKTSEQPVALGRR